MEEIREEETDDQREVNFDEDILAVISPTGRFQKRLMAWVFFQDIANSVCIMFFLFAGLNPGFTCIEQNEDFNQTVQQSLSFNGTCNQNTTCVKRLYNTEFFKSIVAEWDLVCERSIYNTYISSAMLFGPFLGAPFFSWLADGYGRKKVLFPVFAMLITNQMVMSAAPSWFIMLIFRFFTGFFVGGTLVLNFNIPWEIINARWRAFSLFLGGWSVGIMLLVLLAFFIRDWRNLALVSGSCCLPLLLAWFIVPESARWLIQKKRYKAAESQLQWIARVNKRPEPDFTLLPKITKQDEVDSSLERYTFLDLFQTRSMAINITILSLYFMTAAAGYYGTSMNARQLSGNHFKNVLLSAALEQIILFSLLFTTQWFGRKVCIVGYTLCGGTCLLVMAITVLTEHNETASIAQTAFSLIGRASISGAWLLSDLLPAELFPTLIRNTACGFGKMISRLGGVAAPFIAHLYEVHPSIPYAIFGTLALLSSVAIALAVPETKNLSMPDRMPSKAMSLCSSWKKNRKASDNHGNIYKPALQGDTNV